MNIKRISMLIILSVWIFTANANNIQIQNIKLVDQDVEANTVFVQFDLSWENSWKISNGPANHDAAWIFVKYRTSGGNWNHMYLRYVDGINDGHISPPEATIKTAPVGIGCFIYRSTDGTGNNNFQSFKLIWDYSSSGLQDNALIEVKVFGVEMVYVPEEAFSIGTNSSNDLNRFYVYPFGVPFLISSENSINVGQVNGRLYYQNSSGTFGGDQLGPIPSTFPKGYNAFYCMKYEISQGQWVAFFNTLTEAQKLAHDLTDIDHKSTDNEVGRNGISWEQGDASTSNDPIPLNYCSWDDFAAYLDWAGLRPMTELEYEKACRGPLPSIAQEFAWGNNEIQNISSNPYVFINMGTENELISNPIENRANVICSETVSGLGGPARCGICAASAPNKNRINTGGTYYGIMEMTGNLYERTITVGNPTGRAFTGLHGDGLLQINGLANVANWPTSTNGGYGYRGGSYSNPRDRITVSDRYDGANSADITNSRIGGRGVRTE